MDVSLKALLRQAFEAGRAIKPEFATVPDDNNPMAGGYIQIEVEGEDPVWETFEDWYVTLDLGPE